LTSKVPGSFLGCAAPLGSIVPGPLGLMPRSESAKGKQPVFLLFFSHGFAVKKDVEFAEDFQSCLFKLAGENEHSSQAFMVRLS